MHYGTRYEPVKFWGQKFKGEGHSAVKITLVAEAYSTQHSAVELRDSSFPLHLWMRLFVILLPKLCRLEQLLSE